MGETRWRGGWLKWLSGLAVLAMLTLCAGCQTSDTASMELLAEGFDSPMGIAPDSRGLVYVAETGANQVVFFEHSGEKTVFAADVAKPTGVAVDKHGEVYVSSWADGAVYRFSKHGERRTHVDGLQAPTGLWFDTHGRLLVCESGAGRILRISGTGEREVLVEHLSTPTAALAFGGKVIAACTGGLFTSNAHTDKLRKDPAWPSFGLAKSPTGEVYTVDRMKRCLCRISNGRVEALCRLGVRDVTGLACDRDGNVLLATPEGAVYRVRIPRRGLQHVLLTQVAVLH